MDTFITIWQSHLGRTLSICILIGMMFVNSDLTAQEAAAKIKPKLRLSYVKDLGGSTQVKASVYYIEDGERIYCEGAPVGFYTDEDGEDLFEEVKVNDAGEAILQLDHEGLTAFEQSPGHYYFFAQIEKNDKYKSLDEELYVTDADIKVNFEDNDSLKTLEAYFLASVDSAGAMIPVADVPLKVFVKRAFALLPVGGDFTYTDEDGKIMIPFPQDIPGDENGDLTVVVKVDEDEDYGTVQFEEEVNWGVPSLSQSPIAERSLIGARDNAPLFMVVSINIILFGIWGYLLYLLYGLVRIKKLGKVS